MRPHILIPILGLGLLGACATSSSRAPDYPFVRAQVETEPVTTEGDAADDPAIWVNEDEPGESLVLATDKQAGLFVYDLSGAISQFLPVGPLNNVDLRKDVDFGGGNYVDLAVATQPSTNSVIVFEISDAGKVSDIYQFTASVGAYGLCAGYDEYGFRVFVTYREGKTEIYSLIQGKDDLEEKLEGILQFSSGLEGCSYDEVQNVLFVGEEEVGLWRVDIDGGKEIARKLLDPVGSETGLVADVEGVDIWRGPGNNGFVVASAQAGDRFAVYERGAPNRWVGTFRVRGAADGSIDGASHTDGISITSTTLPGFDRGMLVVQDDENGTLEDVANQNFKYVSWQSVVDALTATPVQAD